MGTAYLHDLNDQERDLVLSQVRKRTSLNDLVDCALSSSDQVEAPKSNTKLPSFSSDNTHRLLSPDLATFNDPTITSQSKRKRWTPLQELTQLVREAEKQQALRKHFGPDTKDETTRITSAAKRVELAPVVLASHSLPPPQKHADPGTTQHDTAPGQRNLDVLGGRGHVEQDLREQLQETCSNNVNNDCTLTGSDVCSSHLCNLPHIRKVWWQRPGT